MSLKIYTLQLEIQPLEFSGVEFKTFAERIVDDIHNAGIANKAVNLFYNAYLETAETPMLMVRDMGGIPDINPTPQIQLQFQARGGSWDEAREFAALVFNHFHGATNKSITGYRILSALADGLPASMGEDENQRHLVGFGMVFRAHSTNQVSENVGYGGTRDPNEP